MGLVDVNPGLMIEGCNSVINVNNGMDGNTHTFKTSMVEKSFAQTQEIDYEETFLPVAEKGSIWFFIPIVSFFDYKIWY